jgi:hypothetical protein
MTLRSDKLVSSGLAIYTCVSFGGEVYLRGNE